MHQALSVLSVIAYVFRASAVLLTRADNGSHFMTHDPRDPSVNCSAGLRYLGPRLDIIMGPLPSSVLPSTLTPLEVRGITHPKISPLAKLKHPRTL